MSKARRASSARRWAAGSISDKTSSALGQWGATNEVEGLVRRGAIAERFVHGGEGNVVKTRMAQDRLHGIGVGQSQRAGRAGWRDFSRIQHPKGARFSSPSAALRASPKWTVHLRAARSVAARVSALGVVAGSAHWHEG
jgi:hypothetical protein